MADECLEELAARCEKATGPDRTLDAEIMFDLFAAPVGKHKVDDGPTGYLWPKDNASWNFGLRFPGKTREWFTREGRRDDRETLLIERDGSLVLMNSLRIPKLTESIEAAMGIAKQLHDIAWIRLDEWSDEHRGAVAAILPKPTPNETVAARGCNLACALIASAIRAKGRPSPRHTNG